MGCREYALSRVERIKYVARQYLYMKRISGPLDLWHYPIINAIIALANTDINTQEEFTPKEYTVNRDEDGKIESIEMVQGETDE